MITPCACMGPQGNDPVCPCIMRSRGLEPSGQWTDDDKRRFAEALEHMFAKRKQDEQTDI